MDDLLREFLTESAESLTVVDGELVRLERDPNNKDVLGKIFRLVHTIKGTCGFIGLPRLEKVAHISENLLGKFRDGELSVTPGAVTLILESLDRIKEILAKLEETGTEPAGDDTSLISRLEKAVAGETAEGDMPRAAEPVAQAPVAAAAAAPHVIVEAEQVEMEAVAEAAPPPAAKAGAPAAAQAGGAKGESVANQSIRVNVDVIENLMVMVSELVLTRNQLLEMVRHLNDSEFKVPLQRLSNVTADLQEGVVKTRMQPIGNAWQKLPRIVRDLSNELRKKMDLQMFGAETELDRQVLELIKDPLTHMIRNSADHGLETPAERKAAGKPETGIITLKAYHEGGHIIIEVGDDGKGLPTEKIRAKAIANGIVSEAEGAKLTDAQVHRFIFHAGLSTATAVTNVSGRGVGMDVVRSNIELIGGSVDLKSTQGNGTKFTIKIPLTLAIMSALIVGVRDQRFAIPQVCVLELVRAGRGSEARIERINRTPVLRLRNRLLPLVTLSEILSVDDQPSTAKAEEAFIVIAQAGGRSFGIVVDSVFDTGEIVVKPLAQALKGVSMFSGNTILGDGSVIMILDPNGVASAVAGEIASRGGNEEARAAASSTERTDVQALLLFRAGSQEPKAVPLSLVTRLEMVEAARIERSDGRLVLQYRGNLVPLVTFDMSQQIQSEGRQPVLVFTDGDRTVGMAVDEILDIVDATLNLELASTTPGMLGTAVVRGKATEVVDISSCVGDAFRNGFVAKASKKSSASAAVGRRILFVDDSPFFRTLMAPLLKAAGYQVTEAANAELALKMKEEGKAFDLILSDIDMPGMGGHAFAKAVKNDPTWGATPVVGLAAEEGFEENGNFDVVTQKFDRDNVIATIRSYMDVRSAA